MGLGWIIGEEILYTKDNQQKLIRYENCSAKNDACALQISVDILTALSSTKTVKAGGGNLTKDYDILLSLLEKNYQVKKEWRVEANIIERTFTTETEND
jgi:hypothetical protein